LTSYRSILPLALRNTLAGVLVCASLAGCGRFKPVPEDHFVFVTAKQANLRDRVAAVSNRTGEVNNGDKLKALDHARHWVKVQTAKGEIGWIEEKAVATQEQADDFAKLGTEHKGDPTVAGGVVRDQVYMHIAPGRDTEHFFLLNEGDKLQLVRRATLEKATPGAAVARAQRAIPQAAGTNAVKKNVSSTPGSNNPAASVAAAIAKGKASAAPAPPPVMEDWWLARDAAGHTGWVYARMVDVDAPDALTRYSEGQKFVGAYVLTTVHDDEATPAGPADVPIYVTVLAPYKAGLPYDFDQVRVFTWSVKKHRYETAFRDKNIEGYLPVVVSKMKDPTEKSMMGPQVLPAFTYKVLAADSPPVAPNPQTGEIKPGKLITKTYRLEETTLHRIGWGPGALTAEDEAHPAPEEKKGKGRRK
jgi:SH3-like domain-containing protein